MKIIIKVNEQQPKVTIDLDGVHYSYAIRDAIKMALELDGYTKSTINEVFNLGEDLKVEGN